MTAKDEMAASEKKRPTRTNVSTDDLGGSALSLLKAVYKRWPIVVATLLATSGASLLYSKSLPKVYEASAMLEFDPNVIRPLAAKTDQMRGFSGYWDNREYYETQYKVMTSERVMSAVVRDLSLQNDIEFLGRKPSSPPIPVEDAAGMLRSHIKIEPIKGSRLVLIKVEDTHPKLARRLCDAVVRTYITQNLEQTVNATADAVVWLNSQLDHYKGELDTSENSLHSFKERNELPSSTLDEVSKMIRLEMLQYDEALTRTRTRKQELVARHAELAKVSSENPDQVPASELLGNTFLGALRVQFQQATRERRELLAEGKGESHPSVKKMDEKIAETRRDLLEEVKNIQGAVERDLAVIGRQELGEAGLYEAARKRAVELNLKELEYHRLDRIRVQNEKLYGTLIEQTKDADLARMMNVNNIRLVDGAAEPKAPMRPNVPANVGIGVLLGLFLGVGLALLREQLDNTLKTPADLEQTLGVTFLGLLPEMEDEETVAPNNRKRKRARQSKLANYPHELAVHYQPLSGLAEAARTLRTNLMFMNPDNPHRRLLVTSAAPAEGKTTVACSIAISMAQSGQRVCVIDCDLRRPRLHRIFDRVGDAGLTNVLVGEATLDDVALPTIVDNLWCVPAGPTPPNPADVLHSERFKKILLELGERFDRIVIDSPPLVAVTDSAIVSTLVDGVVYVVRAFSTNRQVSKQGLRALTAVDAPIVGAVLNAVNLAKHAYSYYQYYYYKREGYRPIAQPDESESAATPPN